MRDVKTPLLLACSLLLVACGNDESNASSNDAGSGSCPSSGVSKRPFVQHVSAESALVRWEGCRSSASPTLTFGEEGGGSELSVEATHHDVVIPNTYGAAFAPEMEKDEAGTYTMFDATLTGLAAGTCYRYTLAADPALSGRFCTARPAGESFEILAMGDTNPGLGATPKLFEQLANESYDLTLHAGDIQYYASGLETWVYWFGAMAPALSQGAFLPAVGNHEYEKDDEYQLYYQRFFDQAGFDGDDGYFRAESGGVWFFFWNTETDESAGSPQMTWLEKNLADAALQPGYRFSIFTLHRPMLTCGDKSQNDGLRATLEPLFEKYGVKLVLQGHMHGYERFVVPQPSDATKSFTYLTVGGGGGALEDVNKNADRPTCQLRQSSGSFYQMTVLEVGAQNLHGRTVDVDGKVRDEFDIAVP
jgi:hypothetical protein